MLTRGNKQKILDRAKQCIFGPYDRELNGIWVVKNSEGRVIKRWKKQLGYMNEGEVRKILKREMGMCNYELKEHGLTKDDVLDMLIEEGSLQIAFIPA